MLTVTASAPQRESNRRIRFNTVVGTGLNEPIFIDDRTGSCELAPLIPGSVLCRLDFGDFAFLGNGPTGVVTVGIERKTVNDALACMLDGRFVGHQLVGLLGTYSRVWLVVEGLIRAAPSSGILRGGKRLSASSSSGVLQIGKGSSGIATFGGRWVDCSGGTVRFTYQQFAGWLTSLEMLAGVRVLRTADRTETAVAVQALHHWWQREWADHGSTHTFHEDRPDEALLTKPGIVRRIAAELGGVGWKRSASVTKRFRTVAEMVAAPEADWYTINGIGKKLAASIWKELHNG